MLLVGGMLAWRQLRHHRGDGARHVARPTLDDPIITFSPTFACQCPRALKVLLTATVVGALTGLLGVGGGFLVVPAQIGRASCRERVCKYVWISVVAVSLKKKIKKI